MPGTYLAFCSGLPYSSKVGPNIITPMPPIGFQAPMRPISCCSTRACAVERPPAPYSFGQVGTPQPLSPIAFFHLAKSEVSDGPSSPIIMPPLPFSDGGKLASSHLRASRRKASRSVSAFAAALMHSLLLLYV